MTKPTPSHGDHFAELSDEDVLRQAVVFDITRRKSTRSNRFEAELKEEVRKRQLGNARNRIATRAREITDPQACYDYITAAAANAIAARAQRKDPTCSSSDNPTT